MDALTFGVDTPILCARHVSLDYQLMSMYVVYAGCAGVLSYLVFPLACLFQVVNHMVRGAPCVTITGQSGIGKTQVWCSRAASVFCYCHCHGC